MQGNFGIIGLKRCIATIRPGQASSMSHCSTACRQPVACALLRGSVTDTGPERFVNFEAERDCRHMEFTFFKISATHSKISNFLK
jgi:hypothetical protein